MNTNPIIAQVVKSPSKPLPAAGPEARNSRSESRFSDVFAESGNRAARSEAEASSKGKARASAVSEAKEQPQTGLKKAAAVPDEADTAGRIAQAAEDATPAAEKSSTVPGTVSPAALEPERPETPDIAGAYAAEGTPVEDEGIRPSGRAALTDTAYAAEADAEAGRAALIDPARAAKADAEAEGAGRPTASDAAARTRSEAELVARRAQNDAVKTEAARAAGSADASVSAQRFGSVESTQADVAGADGQPKVTGGPAAGSLAASQNAGWRTADRAGASQATPAAAKPAAPQPAERNTPAGEARPARTDAAIAASAADGGEVPAQLTKPLQNSATAVSTAAQATQSVPLQGRLADTTGKPQDPARQAATAEAPRTGTGRIAPDSGLTTPNTTAQSVMASNTAATAAQAAAAVSAPSSTGETGDIRRAARKALLNETSAAAPAVVRNAVQAALPQGLAAMPVQVRPAASAVAAEADLLAARGESLSGFGMLEADAPGLPQLLAEASAGVGTVHRPETPRLVAAQLAEAFAAKGEQKVEVSLNPQELGQVRMRVSASETGITVMIQAERPETGDLMRRHIHELAEEFRRMGYENISFEFSGGQNGGAFQNSGSGSEGSGAGRSTRTTDAAADDAPVKQNLRLGNAGVDMRV